MSLIDRITSTASRVAGDAQHSLRRARLEGERRVLQRRYRAALAALGERTYELIKAGVIPDTAVGPELADVEARLMEIDAASEEITAMRDPEDLPAS